MSSDLEQMEEMALRLERLALVPAAAAAPALAELLQVARAEWRSGESPGGAGMEPLHAGSGAPLVALTSQITGATRGTSLVITTPDPLKFHQRGFLQHTGGLGDALREAQAAARNAKSVANPERRKRALGRIRAVKKEIARTVSRTAARPTLPGRKAMPTSWGQAIQRAVDRVIAQTLQGAT